MLDSIRNMFQFLASQIINNKNVLLVSEIKLDDSFPMGQLLLDGFSRPLEWFVAQMGVQLFFM